MTAQEMDATPEGVLLDIKTLGVHETLAYSNIEDAADHAIRLINLGAAIPKSIRRGNEVIMSEADINLYWESSR